MKKLAERRPSPKMIQLLRECGSDDFAVSMAARKKFAKALQKPLQRGVLKGDNVGNIFQRIYYPPGVAPEYPLDFISPGTEGNFKAFAIPSVGRIPENAVSGDYVMVPLYEVGNTIDAPLRYIRDANWPVVARMKQAIEAGHVLKKNADGWHVILAAGNGRNFTVSDGAATAGLFTKRLMALAMTSMRRNAGGNATSLGGGRLTDTFISPEGAEDMRSWDLSQIDDFTRRQIFIAGGDGPAGELAVTRIFNVNVHILDELGVSQEYQNYWTGTLGASMTGSKQEIMVGIDLSADDSFVQPFREEIKINEDPTMARQRRYSLWSTEEYGLGCLDSRRVIILEF